MDKRILLIKYFNDDCTPEEKRYLLEHLKPQDVKNYHEVIKNLWDEFMIFPTMEASVSDRLYQKISEKANIPAAPNQTQRNMLSYPLAAILACFVVCSAFLIFFHLDFGATKFQTAYGEKKQIVLPDSSVVTLNSNSTLKYYADKFSAPMREVWVTGEAYFDVKKKLRGGENIKFMAYSEGVTVEVLGTRFNVNTRRENTEVVLESGKIKLHIENDDKELVMKPGDLVSYSVEEKIVAQKTVAAANYSSWRENKLVHHNGVTLLKIAKLIEDNYGYEVALKDPTLAQKTYKGVFPADDLNVLLESLSKSFDLTIEIKNRKITLKRKSSL